jgi:hypothetical protein
LPLSSGFGGFLSIIFFIPANNPGKILGLCWLIQFSVPMVKVP